MLQALAFASILCFVGVGGALGVRLLSLARRQGGVPELSMGLHLFLIAVLGYPLVIAAEALREPAPDWSRLAQLGAGLAADGGVLAVYVFTWRVFRPGSAWAKGLVLGAAALLAVTWGAQARGLYALEDLSLAAERLAHWSVLFFAVAALGFAWSAGEALAYHAKLRRRLALGLTDPVVANRCLLWGLSGVFTTTASVVNGLFVATGSASILVAVPLLVTALCGFGNSAVLFLAFLPPEAWLRRVRRFSSSPAG